MQNKNNKKVNNPIRRFHEQVGIMLILAATISGLVTMSQQARSVLKAVALRPAFIAINHTGKENETARMPVRYDDVLRLQTISGQ